MDAPKKPEGTIYAVFDMHAPAGSPPRLVLAKGRAQATGHVTKPRYTARPLGALEVAAYMGEGIKVEQAKAEQLTIAGTAT